MCILVSCRVPASVARNDRLGSGFPEFRGEIEGVSPVSQAPLPWDRGESQSPVSADKTYLLDYSTLRQALLNCVLPKKRLRRKSL